MNHDESRDHEEDTDPELAGDLDEVRLVPVALCEADKTIVKMRKKDRTCRQEAQPLDRDEGLRARGRTDESCPEFRQVSHSSS
jgi:hypothetical protein